MAAAANTIVPIVTQTRLRSLEGELAMRGSLSSALLHGTARPGDGASGSQDGSRGGNFQGTLPHHETGVLRIATFAFVTGAAARRHATRRNGTVAEPAPVGRGVEISLRCKVQ